MKVDFAWFLSMWLLVYHGDERVFWRTMNPVRCHRLYAALLPKTRKTPEPQQKKPGSLYAYLMGDA